MSFGRKRFKRSHVIIEASTTPKTKIKASKKEEKK